jgi:hypothetical protein
MLIGNAPLLDTDDAFLFRNVCAALLDEVPPQSILDQIDANDLAYNLTLETRYRRGIAATQEQNRVSFINVRDKRTKKELRGEFNVGARPGDFAQAHET